jgi:hypothetical protein
LKDSVLPDGFALKPISRIEHDAFLPDKVQQIQSQQRKSAAAC